MRLAKERGRVEDGRARCQAGGPAGQGYLLERGREEPKDQVEWHRVLTPGSQRQLQLWSRTW